MTKFQWRHIDMTHANRAKWNVGVSVATKKLPFALVEDFLQHKHTSLFAWKPLDMLI